MNEKKNTKRMCKRWAEDNLVSNSKQACSLQPAHQTSVSSQPKVILLEKKDRSQTL